MRRIDERTRKLLKKPIGKLLKDIRSVKSGKIISVGDIVSHGLIENKIIPSLFVYDNKVKRKPVAKGIRSVLDSVERDTFYLKNPRGHIEEEAWIAIEEALKKKSKIIVDGEEDLLVLPIVMLAKPGYSVVYGQPDRGIVLIKVTENKKKEVKKLLNKMEVIV